MEKSVLAQLLGYILISIVLNPLKKHNRPTETLVSVSVWYEIICWKISSIYR